MSFIISQSLNNIIMYNIISPRLLRIKKILDAKQLKHCERDPEKHSHLLQLRGGYPEVQSSHLRTGLYNGFFLLLTSGLACNIFYIIRRICVHIHFASCHQLALKMTHPSNIFCNDPKMTYVYYVLIFSTLFKQWRSGMIIFKTYMN